MNWNDWLEYRNGQLYWKVHRAANAKIGDSAGSLRTSEKLPPRYWIAVNGKQAFRARVVWEMHNGPIPKGAHIDHINHDTLDDRIENLRLTTRSQNMANRRAYSKSGFKGVNAHKSKWRARINVAGRMRNLGLYDSPEIAALVFNAAAFDLHGLNAHLNEVVI